MSKIKTRFAPSPTGPFHLGSARTALYNYLFTKQQKGELILRIEDTDKKRSKKEFEEGIIKSLKWLNIEYDKIYRQSERTSVYKKYIKKLIDVGYAYVSEESPNPNQDKSNNSKVIRFKNPNKKVKFTDLILGEIETDTTELGDFIIAKDQKTPLYHLAVVIDDMEMGITHIIRGQDHISNTARQILIQEALEAEITPKYAHIPLILGPDKSKLSKRHGAAVSLSKYCDLGYLSEAIINFLAMIGWHPKDKKEIFTTKELIKEFNLAQVQKGGGIFDLEKLDWVNKEHIKKLSDKDKLQSIKNYLPKIEEKMVPVVLERISKWSDINKKEFSYLFEKPKKKKYNPKNLIWKNSDKEKTIRHLRQIREIILTNLKDCHYNSIKNAIWPYAEKEGRGDVLWPMRYALSGKEKSPDPFTLVEIYGLESSAQSFQIAIDKLEKLND